MKKFFKKPTRFIRAPPRDRKLKAKKKKFCSAPGGGVPLLSRRFLYENPKTLNVPVRILPFPPPPTPSIFPVSLKTEVMKLKRVRRPRNTPGRDLHFNFFPNRKFVYSHLEKCRDFVHYRESKKKQINNFQYNTTNGPYMFKTNKTYIALDNIFVSLY